MLPVTSQLWSPEMPLCDGARSRQSVNSDGSGPSRNASEPTQDKTQFSTHPVMHLVVHEHGSDPA